MTCHDDDVERVFLESGADVLNKPITLKTEGKADVVVTILLNPDGQEHCFVNETGFRDLSQETGEKVDWVRYDKLNSEQAKFMKMFSSRGMEEEKKEDEPSELESVSRQTDTVKPVQFR